ncbi:ExeM/NucH family extracellular endonuclease [Marinicella meishanensis]|uniref:ExeM/NucH family extracellular endonuclease n=1 Tax=Marinicella meishanensis TaxID=2873263 RepID=UPI001CBAC76D|nr:ExeM/NucH family extracellular endonuclease [Marinicella sp. NBU2979]
MTPRLYLTALGLITTMSGAVQAVCDQTTTPIAQIQGAGSASTWVNQEVWVKGVVTADFRGPDGWSGFFIQSHTRDSHDDTSEGLFVRDDQATQVLQAGDEVLIKGRVSEQYEVTQLNPMQSLVVCQSGQLLPPPVALQLPMDQSQLEAVEGMRVHLSDHVITDVYSYLKYGEMTVSSQLLLSPTALYRPGPKVKQHQALLSRDRLIIDDGRMNQYPQPWVAGADGRTPVGAKNAIQMGQSVAATGVLHFAYGKYKLQPTEPLQFGEPLANAQLVPPIPAGRLQLATFNVENFFTTLDEKDATCGPLRDFGCRGADSAAEFGRQLAKLVAVINTADPAVLGVQELENNATASIQALVDGLNRAAGQRQWDFIDTGALGEDVIKVGLIYQPARVKPVGAHALLNAAADPDFLEHRNRVVVAQTFSDPQNRMFNVATVHFKSKSCRDAEGLDLDQGDGQGCYNPTRVQVAGQLARWLAADPTGQGAQATFIVGDFNSYQQEDPMVTLHELGFVNLAGQYMGPKNWTASFRGAVGSLDYVLANEAAQQRVKGLTQWHINSVAIHEFDYNMEPLGEDTARPQNFYQANPYASSDHDWVMVGFD